MHRYGALSLDIGCAALSPFIALLIRENFVIYTPHWEAIITYAGISIIASLFVFVVTGQHKPLWQYTSLPDVLRILGAVTIAILLAVSISFAFSRLEGVGRSVPIIQWFLMVGGMLGARGAFRLWHEDTRRERSTIADRSAKHVLLVGTGPLTELYLRSVAEYGAKNVAIVGILSQEKEFGGRRLSQYEILGTPEDLSQIIARFEVHGIIIERIVVMKPIEEFSRVEAEALLAVERDSDIKVEWILEGLGLGQPGTSEDQERIDRALDLALDGGAPPAGEKILSLGKYGYVKRVFDVLIALLLGVVLAPLLFALCVIVYLDVGVPLVFWQQRPGRFGRPFKLFKFRTMRSAHDSMGKRIIEEHRSSIIGAYLRRMKLDELPQLYNILIGEMSFVGPRPLLVSDQPENMMPRLSVRPGLTGFAQVHGGRLISSHDKNTLDVWYVRNASLWWDIKILLRTAAVLISGERINHSALRAARKGLEGHKAEGIPDSDGYPLAPKIVEKTATARLAG